MLSKRLVPTLSGTETQSVRHQWLCYRCFHASLRQRASEDSKPAHVPDTPINAPKRGPTRQQRAAKVSQELQMLQRDRPSPSFGEADPNTLRPPGAGKTVDPEAIGMNVGRGSLGNNSSASQEGPYSQGINLNARTDVSAGVDTRAARGTGQPFTVEDASERAGRRLARGLGGSDGKRLTGPVDRASSGRTGQTLESIAQTAATSIPVELTNRLNMLQEPTLRNSTRKTSDLARNLGLGQTVQFESVEKEAAAVEAAGLGGTDPKKPAKVSDLEGSVRATMLSKLVAGRYQNDDLLKGGRLSTNGHHAVLDQIERLTRMNGTYLPQDGTRLLLKVKSLLPKAPAPRAPPKSEGAST